MPSTTLSPQGSASLSSEGAYPGQVCRLELPRGVIMPFRWCPPGTFLMGSPAAEVRRSDAEAQCDVQISAGFWLAETPVTEAQWAAVMDAPAPNADAAALPKAEVSWNDLMKPEKGRKFFFDRLEASTGQRLTLPTEAQWEYACLAGSLGPFGIGTGRDLNAQMANFNGTHPYGTGPGGFPWVYRNGRISVGQFPPNAWGFYDMHGQHWEWCEEPLDSAQPGRLRVLRGGSWIGLGGGARSAYRDGWLPDNRDAIAGFRPSSTSR